MSVILYFVTVLVFRDAIPSSGWIQRTLPYENLEFCQYYVKYNKNSIISSVVKYYGKSIVRIGKIECITRQEAIERNTKLGH